MRKALKTAEMTLEEQEQLEAMAERVKLADDMRSGRLGINSNPHMCPPPKECPRCFSKPLCQSRKARPRYNGPEEARFTRDWWECECPSCGHVWNEAW